MISSQLFLFCASLSAFAVILYAYYCENVCVAIFIENSTNGADFHSSETRKKEERPKLTVDYTPP